MGSSWLPQEFDVPLTSGAALPGGTSIDVPEEEPLDLGDLAGDPAIAFRRTLGMLTTGATVVTTLRGQNVHGMPAGAFVSVSLTPPLVLVSLERRARLCAALQEGARFGVSVLAEGQAGLSERLAGRTGDDVPEARFVTVRDTPLVDGALAHLVARVVRSYWGGDHSLVLGQVEHARYGEGRPLLFHDGRYERIVEDPGVFAALPRELLDPLLARGEELAYGDGELLMRRGEPADALFLVLEGTVRVERPGRLTRLVPGDLVGEIEVLAGGPRIANIHAEGPVRVLRVPRDALLVALEADSRAAMALIEVLASRFRETA
jgi:flavin reductase (DIM6/NTAB) family NADH-FMN oxidoreductase RutF